MKSIPISEFKAHCFELVREVQRTGNPIVLTNRGEPTAVVSPPNSIKREFRFGLFEGTAQILDDIVRARPEDWEPEP
jgi:prevent-host-death family protein